MNTIKKHLVSFYNEHYLALRRLRFNLMYSVVVMSPNDTIEYIMRKKCSISRFGDGELGIILGSNKPEFQNYNDSLQKRLVEILRSKDENVLVCLPAFISIRHNWTPEANLYWERWFWDDYKLFKIAKIVPFKRLQIKKYGNSHITRPYMDYENKSDSNNRFMQLRQLWDHRDIVIVEGERSMIGVGNDLLNNCKSIRRVLCPSKNAFDKYDEILKMILKKCKTDDLILAALGPTATVLCYDLSKRGFQALDVGHIDIEYEWYSNKATQKKVIPGKDSWEGGLEQIEESQIRDNKEYNNQIIGRVE